MTTKLFINYRREDTRHAAGRLYDRLIQHFGEDQVFMDIDQIEPGEDFVEVINRKVGSCDVAIVAIGAHWLGKSGKRRLDNEEDFVRMEIVAALQRNIRVIPVLIDGARMPQKQDLPEALAPLSRRHAIDLSETHFHADVSRLIAAIEKPFAAAEKKVELSARPAAPPLEAAAVRPPEPESKALSQPVQSTKPAEAAEPKEINDDTVSGVAAVSLGDPTTQFPTQAAPLESDSGMERGQQESIASTKDPAMPVKSTQTMDIQSATPPIAWSSAITALEGSKVWTRKRLIMLSIVLFVAAALAVPALTSVLAKAQMAGTMNNARQLYLAQFAMANDGAATGDASSAWPGDLTTLPTTITEYLNVLVGKGYLKGADAIKLLNAPGASYTATVTTSGGVDTLSAASGTPALKIWMVKDADPASTIFATSANYTYNTALSAAALPYGSRGFITIKKGGDAAIYRGFQAQAAGWGSPAQFQADVGSKPGDPVGSPSVGDPNTPGVGVLTAP